MLTDARGKLINFSRSWPIPNVKIPDQDPSAVFASDPRLISFVGKPLRSPATGNWVVSIARKLTGPNGEFLGVVQGAMELQYFEKSFGLSRLIRIARLRCSAATASCWPVIRVKKLP